MSCSKYRFIVLTGSPGCGKTTLIKKICHILKEKNISINGFYTEEVRQGRERSGFDVVMLGGERAPLARIKNDNDNEKLTVGKYTVKLDAFQSAVIPVLLSHDKEAILVLDEIGKMELFSNSFRQLVQQLIFEKEIIVLATVPLKSHSIPLVDKIKSHSQTLLYTVNERNRDQLADKLVNHLIEAKKKKKQ